MTGPKPQEEAHPMPLSPALDALGPRLAAIPLARDAALRQYRAVTLEARVAAASPHELVLMLFERLSLLTREARAALLAGDSARRLRATERALAIIDGLDQSLDRARGGEVADALTRAYATLRARLTEGSAAALEETIRGVDEVGSAWRAIGKKG
jgi:flagellar protein FliS